jgi:3-deoxy-D-manno-octulosonic-acid transferase
MRLVYSALFHALVPWLLARLAWRGHTAPEYRRRWGERFGYYTCPKRSATLWLHAVSVGEAEAAFPLVRALLRRYPAHRMLVTTTTPTGSARVQAVLGNAVDHVYLPYDMPGAVERFLDHFRPALAVVMETEIWPNLFHVCGKRGIPLAVVNARLSEKSARGYAKLASLTQSSLANVHLIAAQTEADAARFRAIGAPADRVVVTGNIKYDMELPTDLAAQGAALRARLFGRRPVWIAASTHDGEETSVLEAYGRLRGTVPDVLLLLVPRHPERFDAVHALCRAAGYRVARRSENQTAGDADIFLLDAMGELRLFYATADIAFVGGSLVPVGGHNVLEPAALGLSILFGPYMHHFDEAARGLLAAGGAVQVADARELAARLADWLPNRDTRTVVGARARGFAESGRGALARVETLLAGLLEPAQMHQRPRLY